MKPLTTAAVVATAVALSVGVAGAQNGREIRQNRQDVRQDRRELRQDTRDIRQDRRELAGDRRELRADRRAGRTDEVKQDRAELSGDRRELRGRRAEWMCVRLERTVRALMETELRPCGRCLRRRSLQLEGAAIDDEIEDFLATVEQGEAVADRKRVHGVCSIQRHDAAVAGRHPLQAFTAHRATRIAPRRAVLSARAWRALDRHDVR